MRGAARSFCFGDAAAIVSLESLETRLNVSRPHEDSDQKSPRCSPMWIVRQEIARGVGPFAGRFGDQTQHPGPVCDKASSVRWTSRDGPVADAIPEPDVGTEGQVCLARQPYSTLGQERHALTGSHLDRAIHPSTFARKEYDGASREVVFRSCRRIAPCVRGLTVLCRYSFDGEVLLGNVSGDISG